MPLNDGNIVKRTVQYIWNKAFSDTLDAPVVGVIGHDGSTVNTLRIEADGTMSVASGLIPKQYDYISIPSYNANNDPLTVIYKSGGSGGTTVATLTITYDGDNNVSSVTRS